MNKIFTALLVCLVLNAYAQAETTFDVAFNGTPLIGVIEYLERTSGVSFSYSSSTLPMQTAVSVSGKNLSLTQALDMVLKDLPISYEFLNGNVILKYHQMYQTIRGEITDADSRQPIVGATVVVDGAQPILGGVTDVNGSYRIEKVPVGRVTLKVNCVGFEQKTIPNVLIGVGKEAVVNIPIVESIVKMDEVVIKGSGVASSPMNEMALVSGRSFTVEETKRFAVGLGDPLRLASSFAGVMGSNDLTNSIIIRGNTPRGILWKVEGIEAPNPNHFSLPGASSGGISMLSSQMLSRSDFFTGAFAPQYGNALSGVFDMHLRKGNDQQHERTIQAGLLGLDVSSEGPISRSGGSSYLFNYRYSTLGILSDLGLLDTGESTNTFQDLSFKVNFPTAKLGTFSLFGVGGLSHYHGGEDFFYDQEDYNMGIVGLKNQSMLSNSTYLETSLSWAGTKIIDNYLEEGTVVEYNTFDRNYWRASVILNHKFGPRHSLETGATYSILDFNYQDTRTPYDSTNSPLSDQVFFDDNDATWTQQVYASWKFRLSENLSWVNGAHLFYFDMNEELTIEPRSSIKWKFDERRSISVGLGLHSRMESLEYYLGNGFDSNGNPTHQDNNRTLPVTKAIHGVLGYDHAWNRNTYFKMEFYYQHLYDVPVVDSVGYRWFSTINLTQGYIQWPLVSAGTGKNMGVEFTIDKKFSNHNFLLLTGTIFTSKYTAADGIERNTRYNGNYSFNALGGKEWIVGKKKTNIFGFSSKAGVSGNERIRGNNLEKLYEEHLPTYFRLDLQFYYRKNKKKHTSEWRLDLQNVTARENWSNSADQTFIEPGVGLIPVLSYKVEF